MEPPGIVIDTNVFVSALRSRRGASFRLLSLVGTGRFEVELSVPLAMEYEAVGRRTLPATALTEADFDAILDFVCRTARRREVFYSWRPCLPDPADDMVLELAVAAGGAVIVTFNCADFQGSERFGVRVCGPQEFLAEIGEAPT
jgi:predicted nucleic acid-binding protein